MKKKVLSIALALLLSVGSASVLPQNSFAKQTAITASAESNSDFEYTVGTNTLGKKYIVLTAYKGKAKDVVVPETINGITVKYLNESVFQGNKTIENVKILAPLNYIIQRAFKDCTSLKSAEFADTIDFTYFSVFENCTSLERVKLPDKLAQLNSDFFKGCTKLSDITFPSAITSIPGSALEDTKWLADRRKESSLVLVNGILVDGKTYKDAELTIPSNVKAISSYAFSGNKYLVSVNIPSTVTSLDAFVFENCENLEKAVLNCKVKQLSSTFIWCKKLRDVTLREGIESLQNYVFGHCESLKSIKLPSTIKLLGFEPFYYCTNLEEINIPDGVEEIGYQAFYQCKSIKKLSLPQGLKKIGTAAFKYSGLNELYIPASVENISGSEALQVSDPNKLTLFCHKNSYTAKYVQDNNIKAVLLPEYLRLAGQGRYETAVSISKETFTSTDTVVLAYSMNYADALAGVPFAKHLNAPILLTNTNELDRNALFEMHRLRAKNVKILGGEGAISNKVVTALENSGFNVERIAGKTRFSTAAAIAEKLNESPEEVFFVYGLNYADALSASSIASIKNAPIIYLTTKGELDSDTKAYLEKLKNKKCVKKAYVIGGEGVISNDMMNNAAKALGLPKATRVAGDDRFSTCIEVNKMFADDLSGKTICVATGMDFPDALAGGVYAAKNNAPLFLINGKTKTPALSDLQKDYLKQKEPDKTTIFGGIGVVPDEHVIDLDKCSI
ncbi:MAG: leucine-rich repeat protein [Ruminococcus sp.]|nr:leucine-rich repeat protein [Ruminococcus sp.]